MATVVSTGEAEAMLATLIDRALDGEEIVIERAGTPVVKLTPLTPEPVSKPKRELPWGNARGEIWISEDFDDPLPDDLLDLFEGKGKSGDSWP